MEKALRPGDLINVQAESIGSEYEANGDITLVQVESTDEMDDMSDFSKLAKMQIYKIVKNDVHADLARFGVNIGHFSLDAIKVKTIAINDSETEVKINGEYNVPIKKKKGRTPLLETYFPNVESASVIATSLNIIEKKKMKQLNSATEKALVTLDQIVAKGYV